MARPSEPLPHFVDDYLSYLHETLPTSAALDGVHAHDDVLEDLSRVAMDDRVRVLGGFARRLAGIGRGSLTSEERIEYPVLDANVKGRLHDLEEVRVWTRSPRYYGELLAGSLAAQAVFDYAPSAERARRVLSKLRQTPRLTQAARDNVSDPPGILVKVGSATFRAILTFLERDLPRAFADVDDLHLLADLADASVEAVAAVQGYIEYLEREQAPKSRASFRLGRELLQQKLRFVEGVTLDVDRLVQIAVRELRETQERFRQVGARLDGGDPTAAWARVRASHPEPGTVVSAAREHLTGLAQFLERQALVSLPAAPPVVVAPTPGFLRWAPARLWATGAFESKPIAAHYYVTDVDPTWPPARQEEHLRELNHGSLSTLSMHEVYPGHLVRRQHLEQVSSKVRKSIVFATPSFVEGWAHYAEQMMLDEGFGRGDDGLRLAQLAEALIRLAQLIVGIRLHAEDLSVEQGMRFFRDEAFMEEARARRESERVAYDPSAIASALGKLMLLKLREDYAAAQDSRYSLRTFHDALLAHGSVPFSCHRALLLGADSGALLE